ncbi:hypothetical protein NUACC21_01260 [Scytonema sp. NUACC21]
MTQKDREAVRIIHECGTHLLMLIDDILDLSKIEARTLELVATNVHLPTFLQGVTGICGIRAEQKGIGFNVLIDHRLPVAIQVDEKRLRQVLINLLGNAIKFTDTGSVTFKIDAIEQEVQQTINETTQITHQTIRFQIEDTGIGMLPDQLEKIFLAFEQVGDAGRKSEGTGLGLAISQKIATLMGSQIQVQSRLGGGSLFWLDLTVAVPVSHDWHIYTQSEPQPLSVKNEQIDNSNLIVPSQDVLQQLYHLAMMGDIPAIEGMIGELIQQDSQLTPFAIELSKLTANFQTAKIRKFLKSFVTPESFP